MKPKHLNSQQAIASYAQLCNELSIAQLQVDRKVKIYLALKFVFFIGSGLLLYWSICSTANGLLLGLCFGLFGCWNILFSLNFAHDAAHDSLFVSKKWNFYCFATLYTLLGAHPHSWKERHTHAHHHAPNVEGLDTDLALLKILRVLPQAPRLWYHRFQVLYMPLLYAFYSLHWICIKDPIYVWRNRTNQNRPNRYVLVFLLLKGLYFGYLWLLPSMLSPLGTLHIAFGFLGMHIVQSLFLALTFIMTHHVAGSYYPELSRDGISCSWLENQVRSSNDIWPQSQWANFFFGGFNCHIAHHLFPTINHYYYPTINKQLYPLLIQLGFEPQHGSYLDGLIKHLKLLWIRGKAA